MECRETLLNGKLAREWVLGHSWADQDFFGVPFTLESCNDYLAALEQARDIFWNGRASSLRFPCPLAPVHLLRLHRIAGWWPSQQALSRIACTTAVLHRIS